MFLDLETTGLNHDDEIVELAIKLVEINAIMESLLESMIVLNLSMIPVLKWMKNIARSRHFK